MSPTYVQIAVNVSQKNNIFDYHLPPDLEGEVLPGCLVEVPFGRQTVQGVVLSFVETPSIPVTKPVSSLIDPQPVVLPWLLKIAKRMSEETLSPLAPCLGLMIPTGLYQQADTLFKTVPTDLVKFNDLSSLQKRIIQKIDERGGALRGRQLKTAFPRQNWQAAVKNLQQKGLLVSQPVLPPPNVRPRTVRTAQYAAIPEMLTAYLDSQRQNAAAERRRKMLDFLQQEPWPVEVSWVYAASGGGKLADLLHLAEAGLVVLGENETWRDPLEKIETQVFDPPILTPAQQAVWDRVEEKICNPVNGRPTSPILLHGVTGSGKTEIYLRAVDSVIKQGRQAIILVPEIALTPQTVRRFMARFPGRVGLMHSQLSPGERYDTWRRARAGQISVIIGARSALFCPLSNPGLVVIDECHETTYYQDDFQPYYNAIRAALWFCEETNSLLLLGSATPPLEWREYARTHGWDILSLPQRVLAHRQAIEDLLADSNHLPANNEEAVSLPLPPVSLIDMRQELTAGNRSMFSRELQDALKQVLDTGRQAILFLNRRGSATYVFCRHCGHVLRCPRCDLPLTFHAGANLQTLRCHTCAYTRQMPKTCPACSSTQIRQYGAGTEKVEAEVKQLFPQARTLRWDYESTRYKGAHDIILTHFSNHQADILIGTQMLAKGLDLPLVTLVGVVLADVGLNLPDFRAAEKTFQLLMQVAGRAGRSALGGKVVIQTFMPEHYAIKAAAAYDYEGFITRELAYRKDIKYPPFYRLARLEYRHSNPAAAEKKALDMAHRLQEAIDSGEYTSSELIGPAPCFFSKINGVYRWQIILRSPDPLKILHQLRTDDWFVLIDPINLL